uniref:Uncharacterized protein n=1 Tax=Strix occidentalis caurina TaxID=311401 RepID=A0A8D0L0L3_STROC
MALKPCTYPLPETRFLHAGRLVYKFKIRYVILGNLDDLHPFSTDHFTIFPYLSKWERVSEMRFKHEGVHLVPYPYICTMYLELNSFQQNLSCGKSVWLCLDDFWKHLWSMSCFSLSPRPLRCCHLTSVSFSRFSVNFLNSLRPQLRPLWDSAFNLLCCANRVFIFTIPCSYYWSLGKAAGFSWDCVVDILVSFLKWTSSHFLVSPICWCVAPPVKHTMFGCKNL